MKLLDEQQEVKVSKEELDTEQWKNERMEALGEQEEEEPNEVRTAPETRNQAFSQCRTCHESTQARRLGAPRLNFVLTM